MDSDCTICPLPTIKKIKHRGYTIPVVDDLDEVFETISQNPERQFLVEQELWHSEGVRKIKVKNYLVYFWIDVENAAVQVIGVCYAKRDQIKFLNGIDIE